jgi:hypothetical protein
MIVLSHLLHFRGESRNVVVSAPIGAVLFFGVRPQRAKHAQESGHRSPRCNRSAGNVRADHSAREAAVGRKSGPGKPFR